MPYSNRGLPEYSLQKPWSPEWDCWSLGVIVLEVLVGPRLVAKLDSDRKVREVLNKVTPLIGPELSHIISCMTIFVNDKPLKSILSNQEYLSAELVMKAAQAVDAAENGKKNPD